MARAAATATTSQTRDTYGNLTQQLIYDFGNSSTPAWTYNMTYVTGSNYSSRYIFNRLTYATVTTASGTTTLANINGYDFSNCQYTTPAYSGIMHDSNYGSSFYYRGNPVSVIGYSGTMCYAYNVNGTVSTAQDGSGRYVNVSTSSATNYSLPSAITPNNNNNLTTSFAYSTSYMPSSFTAPNGDQATTTYDQSTGLPQTSTLVDGATVSYAYAYFQSGNSQSVNTQTATLGNQWKRTTLDGFGRAIRVENGDTVSGTSTTVNTVDSQYAACACSPLGKLKQTSLPYAPGGTPVWTVYTYDASGRTLTVKKPDGSSTTNYSYAGNNTTVTDPAGKWKTFTSDASGNLITVTEPNPAGGSNFVTNYTYNATNQLIQVSMQRPYQSGTATQTRSFTWSGTDLASSTNPENGTVTYQYDGAHHLTQRIDAKNQKTLWTYDNYGRLTEVQHFNGYSPYAEDTAQRVTYDYDTTPWFETSQNYNFSQYAWGRLTGVEFQNQSNQTYQEPIKYLYSYNKGGHVVDQQVQLYFAGYNNPSQNPSGLPLALDALYAWDNQGRMTSLAYPSIYSPSQGPTETYSYDNAGRLSAIQETAWANNSWNTSTVASAGYNAAGQITSLSHDTMAESRTYNGMLQLTQETATAYVNGNLTVMNMQYAYSATQNNGRIAQSTDGVTGEIVNYTYDALNRLISAAATAGGWSQSYSYDGWGNMGSGFSPYTNRPSTASADANGNSTAGGMTWDIENRLLISVANTYWGYDPKGKRVFTEVTANQSNNYTTTCELDFYGVSGKKLAAFSCQYDNTGAFTVSLKGYNLYFGGKLIRSSGLAVATDRVGSVRGNANGEIMRYGPYGEERTSTADGREKWGTYFRDAGTGNDYANHRYKGVGAGAFLSADAGGTGTGSPQNPTSWNRYAYAYGDPINFYDPHGRWACNPDFCHEDPVDPEPEPLPPPPSPVPPTPPSDPGGGGSGGWKGGLNTDPAGTGKTAWQYLTSVWGNCLNDFNQLSGFNATAFGNLLQTGIAWLDTRNPAIASTTVDSYSHNGDTTQLGQLFMNGQGNVAVRLLGTADVALGADYFTDETQTEQIAIAIHEALHIATGLGDSALMQALSAFGYKPTGNSQSITDWIVGSADLMSTTSGGCTNPGGR